MTATLSSAATALNAGLAATLLRNGASALTKR